MSPNTQKGFRFEKTITTDLWSYIKDHGFDRRYRVIPSGFSGNHGIPSGDLDVIGPQYNDVIELKNSSADVCTLQSNGTDEDLDQLMECRETDHTRAWVGVKFQRREMVMIRLGDELSSLVENCPDALNPRITRTNNFKVDYPDLSVWPSATSGRDDVDVLLDALGIGTGVEDGTQFDLETTA